MNRLNTNTWKEYWSETNFHFSNFFKIRAKNKYLCWFIIFVFFALFFFLALVLFYGLLIYFLFFFFYIIKIVCFLYIAFNLYDLALLSYDEINNYRYIKKQSSLWFYCYSNKTPYRLKHLIFDIDTLILNIKLFLLNPWRIFLLILLSALYTLTRLTMNIFSIFYKILIISILCASKIINIEFEIGIFDCQNEINSYKILILTILLERSFIEAFSIIYILIRKLRQKNKVIDYKAKNTIETILFIKMFKNSPFKINTILLIEQKLYDLSNSSLWERKNKNFTVIKEELLNLLVSILFSKFSDAIFLKQNLRIFSKDGRIELNSLEWLKIFVPKMRDYTKEVNFGLIEELVACNVRVGGRSHSAIALKPDGVSKAVSTNVDTSKNFVRIGGEFYATAEKSDNNFEYPFSFQLTKLNELQIRLNQETRIMSSYVMGETISNVCAYNLKQSLDTKMYQWKFLFENALQRAIAELEGRYDFQVFLQYKKSKDSLLIDELGIDKFLTDGQNIINIHLKSITDLILSSFGETQFTSIADPIQEMIKSSVDLKREKPDFTDLEKNFIESKRMKFSESGGQVQQLAQAQQIIGAENIPEILTERGLQIKKEKIGSLKLMLEKSKAMNINDFTIIVLDSSDELALSTVTKLIEM